jgi:hypothetical protein
MFGYEKSTLSGDKNSSKTGNPNAERRLPIGHSGKEDSYRGRKTAASGRNFERECTKAEPSWISFQSSRGFQSNSDIALRSRASCA